MHVGPEVAVNAVEILPGVEFQGARGGDAQTANY
jgi:hypothetical protein